MSTDDGLKAYGDGNYKVALPLFRNVAEQGDAVAQFFIGVMYHNGEGSRPTPHLAETPVRRER